MRCADCASWIIARKTVYDDGSVIVNEEVSGGEGRCDLLSLVTPPDFGCLKFAGGDVHEIVTHKPGAPWMHSHAGPCPDCTGKGSGGDAACRRCAGTAKVRYYDDGYIGEEQTRLHPKERAAASPPCMKCGASLDAAWMSCPHCGTRTDKPRETEVIANELRTV